MKQISKGKSVDDVVKTPGGHHVKTICGYLQNSKYQNKSRDKCKSRTVTTQHITYFKQFLIKNTGCTSKNLFSGADIENVSETTRTKLISRFAKKRNLRESHH